MDVRVGLSTEKLMLLNCGVREDSWEFLGLQGDPTSPSKGDQSWVFFGRTKFSAEAETPILWPPYAKSWLIGKGPAAGRDCGQEEKGMTEDEMAGWDHRPEAYEFEWPLGVVDGQGGLACCSSSGHRVGHDWATKLNWNELKVGDHVSFTRNIQQLAKYLAQSRIWLSDWTELNWREWRISCEELWKE